MTLDRLVTAQSDCCPKNRRLHLFVTQRLLRISARV
jgi:hypothetical protein